MSDSICASCGRPRQRDWTSCHHCGAGSGDDPGETVVVDHPTTSESGMQAGATGWSNPHPAGQELSAFPGRGDLIAGRYEVVGLLGKGGMGAVFKAWDRELERAVAMKVMRPELAEDAETLHRFKQELILARQVTHRNVVRIYDLGQSGGMKFITMEYIEGKNLRQILNSRKQVPPEEAAAIVSQACLALEAAHEEGVIHRDLKPQNIMVASRLGGHTWSSVPSPRHTPNSNLHSSGGVRPRRSTSMGSRLTGSFLPSCSTLDVRTRA